MEKSIKWSGEKVEEIADAIAAEDFCVIDHFMNEEGLKELKATMRKHLEENGFRKAGIGNLHHFQIARNIRGDKIKWIDKARALPATLSFLRQIEFLMTQLNRLLYLSLKDYESHFAVYPPGTFYERHLDQFKGTNNRKISFAFYLNDQWKEEDGGELRIFREGRNLDIPPVANRLVLFRSDVVEHEVLKTHIERYSITGWLRDQPVDLPFI